MPFARQRPRVAPHARVSVRLATAQRDRLLAAALPRELGHLLHRARVTGGKLTVRLTRTEIETLITTAAAISAPDRRTDRELASLLRYLESIEDRFANPESDADDAPPQRGL